MYPLISSLYYSFTNYTLGRTPVFVGLENFKFMFMRDPHFFQSLRATLLFVVISVPLKLIFALMIAMMLNKAIRGIGAFRTIYYIPSILGGSVAISVLWRVLFFRNGVVNNALASVGLPAINFFGSPGAALFTLSMLTVWQFGSSMVLFLAALKNIPQELYEAGRVDGASRLQMFFKITVPQITPIILFNTVMQTINAFQEFTSAFVITGGGPLRGTYLYGMKLYEEAFSKYKMGYACALSWLLFAIILVVTASIFRSSTKWVYYADGGD